MFNRLLELIKQADNKCKNNIQCEGCIGFGKGANCVDYNIVECLLANGVIVLPCKVGETVWFIRNKKIIETKVDKIVLKNRGLYIKLDCNSMYETSCNSIGKTVFLIKEEAEKALKGGEG